MQPIRSWRWDLQPRVLYSTYSAPKLPNSPKLLELSRKMICLEQVECGFDKRVSVAGELATVGDCYYCGAECVAKMGNGHCDAECFIDACNKDGGDCQICNEETGCLSSLIDNGICDKQCFNSKCQFDGQDCYHCDLRPECNDLFVGDGVCDPDCYHEDCRW
jgi:hypothetical protein